MKPHMASLPRGHSVNMQYTFFCLYCNMTATVFPARPERNMSHSGMLWRNWQASRLYHKMPWSIPLQFQKSKMMFCWRGLCIAYLVPECRTFENVLEGGEMSKAALNVIKNSLLQTVGLLQHCATFWKVAKDFHFENCPLLQSFNIWNGRMGPGKGEHTIFNKNGHSWKAKRNFIGFKGYGVPTTFSRGFILPVWWGQEIYIFSIFIFYAWFGILLKGMGESFLLSKD